MGIDTFPYDAAKHGGGKEGQPIVNIDMGYIFGNFRSYQNQLEIMTLLVCVQSRLNSHFRLILMVINGN